MKQDSETLPGTLFRKAISKEKPLQIAGTINAYSALLAEKSGFQAIYLSGAGVANASFGIPDLGYTTLENVAEDAQRITNICKLPLLVDADTAWENPEKTVKTLSNAGVAGIHIEDQVEQKRCGHRPGKVLVTTGEMQERIKKAVDAKPYADFIVMARTDAHAVEGFNGAVNRSKAYVDAGADMIFAEAFNTIDQYELFVKQIDVPVLANITEFGKTPLFTVDDLRNVGISMVLYPLSAFRAMSDAALETYQTIRSKGTQASLLGKMQTRDELYQVLNYEKYEKMVDDELKK